MRTALATWILASSRLGVPSRQGVPGLGQIVPTEATIQSQPHWGPILAQPIAASGSDASQPPGTEASRMQATNCPASKGFHVKRNRWVTRPTSAIRRLRPEP
jgi:hypothetical protein